MQIRQLVQPLNSNLTGQFAERRSENSNVTLQVLRVNGSWKKRKLKFINKEIKPST